MGTREAILRVHPEHYVARIENAAPLEGLAELDGETVLSPGSLEAAMRAVGGAMFAVDEVMAGPRPQCVCGDASAGPSCGT